MKHQGARSVGIIVVTSLHLAACGGKGDGDAAGVNMAGIVQVSAVGPESDRTVIVTVDTVSDGVGDGRVEYCIVLTNASGAPPPLIGIGSAKVIPGTSATVTIDAQEFRFHSRQVERIENDTGIRDIAVDAVMRFSAAQAGAILPRGAPGSGRVTHAQVTTYWAERIDASQP